ncbi:MAG: sulfite exporter TauE/SafE family protein [Myxococcales bacterium]
MWQLFALLSVGVAAGFVNVVAGGGSLLTMPLMIFLGLPETTANGTARVAIFVQNASAVVAYRRAGGLDLSQVKPLLLPAILGAVGGAAIASRLSDEGFRDALGVVMLGCAVLVAASPGGLFAAGERRAPRMGAMRVWPIMFAIGVYGGAIQAGVGYLILAGLTLGLGLPLVEANILKILVVFAYTPIALVVFFRHGQVDLVAGLALAAGQALGGYLGARAALRRGERLIRILLLVAVIASALKLLID